MAVEEGKVLAKLEVKFKGKSLTKNFKQAIAKKWAAKIDNDEDIDGYIDDREDVVLEASTEADRRATQATATAKADAANAITGAATPAAEPEPDTEMGKLLKMVSSLTETVTKLQTEKQAETIADRFKKDPRLKGVPDFMLKLAIPHKEEDFETSVTALATEFTQFATDNKLSAFGGDTPAGATTAAPAVGKVDPDIVAFGKNKVAALTEKN